MANEKGASASPALEILAMLTWSAISHGTAGIDTEAEQGGVQA